MTASIVVTTNLAPIDRLQATFPTLTRAYLQRLGEIVRDTNIEMAFVKATNGPSVARILTGAAAVAPRKRPPRPVGSAAGLSYDGQKLPLNQEQTLKAKARAGGRERGGRLWSLLDTGLLLDPRKYRFVFDTPERLQLAVPAGRVHVLRFLADHGYRYWGIPVALRRVQPSRFADWLWRQAFSRWQSGNYRALDPFTFRGL